MIRLPFQKKLPLPVREPLAPCGHCSKDACPCLGPGFSVRPRADTRCRIGSAIYPGYHVVNLFCNGDEANVNY